MLVSFYLVLIPNEKQTYMPDTLTQEQKDFIRDRLSNNTFSPQLEIAKLMELGFEPETAKNLVISEIKAYKKELFDVVVNQNKQDELRNIMFVLIFVIALIGPLFHVQSPLWYIIALIGSGTAGFFGWRSKPIAGVIGAIVATIVFPFAYNAYFEGRSTIIKIEIAVPMILSAIPAVIVYFIIARIGYPNNDQK